jgi:hypothetical protein
VIAISGAPGSKSLRLASILFPDFPFPNFPIRAAEQVRLAALLEE